jgi:hypothetical protein
MAITPAAVPAARVQSVQEALRRPVKFRQAGPKAFWDTACARNERW